MGLPVGGVGSEMDISVRHLEFVLAGVLAEGDAQAFLQPERQPAPTASGWPLMKDASSE